MRPRWIGFFSPARLLILSLLSMIPIATLLLALPICRTTSIAFGDLLFTAISYTTITGLSVIPLSSFSFIGHLVILCLIQVGGIGVITLTFFLVSFFVDFGIAAQIFGARILSLDSWKDTGEIIFFIIKITFFIELIGALIIFASIYQDYSWGYGIFLSIFHAVSAFVSAGLVLFPNGLSSYHNNYLLLFILSLLMIAGEIGFMIWHELIEYIYTVRKHGRFHFSLHTKVVFFSTISITGTSFLLYWMLERCNTLHHLSFVGVGVNALFNAVAARGTGFITLPLLDLQLATLLLIMILTFIGASPGSTGSGIKTTSLTILSGMIKAASAGRFITIIRGRTIPQIQVCQAITIISLSIGWVLCILFFLLITEHATFLELLFEVVSAFGNCGLSMGVTTTLSSFGKVCIALTMMVGRVGCLATMLAFIKKPIHIEYSYPEERIMLG